MAETVNFAPDWFGEGPIEQAEDQTNAALAKVDASINAIIDLRITRVDSSMYLTLDGSTTVWSWAVTAV
ncbi:MAG TPA: hypothetical protein PK122_05135 [Candidatus Paceibacterota bacterium]|nr:hypothetical protein [Candidatus Paceibacterota bacterium]